MQVTKMSHERPRLAVVATALAVVALLLAASAAIAASVTISGFAYSPNPVTVTVGGSITWTNNDPVSHTVTADDASFNSGILASGATFTHAFATPGAIAYHCNIHPTMHGTIQVQVAPTPRPTPRPTRTPRPGGGNGGSTPAPTDTSRPASSVDSTVSGVGLALLSGALASLIVATRRTRRH